jgi:hypothetical protein
MEGAIVILKGNGGDCANYVVDFESEGVVTGVYEKIRREYSAVVLGKHFVLNEMKRSTTGESVKEFDVAHCRKDAEEELYKRAKSYAFGVSRSFGIAMRDDSELEKVI